MNHTAFDSRRLKAGYMPRQKRTTIWRNDSTRLLRRGANHRYLICIESIHTFGKMLDNPPRHEREERRKAHGHTDEICGRTAREYTLLISSYNIEITKKEH